jgi:hypothetical protein
MKREQGTYFLSVFRSCASVRKFNGVHSNPKSGLVQKKENMDLFRIRFPVFDLVVKMFFLLLDDNSVWYMDLKNGAGGCGQGPPPQEADVRLVLFF